MDIRQVINAFTNHYSFKFVIHFSSMKMDTEKNPRYYEDMVECALRFDRKKDMSLAIKQLSEIGWIGQPARAKTSASLRRSIRRCGHNSEKPAIAQTAGAQPAVEQVLAAKPTGAT